MCLTSAKQKGRIISPDLLATWVCLMQPGMMVASFTARVLCCFTVSLVPTETHKVVFCRNFYQHLYLLSSQSVPTMSWWGWFFLRGSRTQQAPLLSSMRFLLVHVSSRSRSRCLPEQPRGHQSPLPLRHHLQTCRGVERLRGVQATHTLWTCTRRSSKGRHVQNICWKSLWESKIVGKNLQKGSTNFETWTDFQWGIVTHFWNWILGFCVTYMVLEGSSLTAITFCRIYNLDGRICRGNEMPEKWKWRKWTVEKCQVNYFRNFFHFTMPYLNISIKGNL